MPVVAFSFGSSKRSKCPFFNDLDDTSLN